VSTRSVYSSILFRQQGVNGAGYSVLVPEGERWVIRDVSIYCNVPVVTTSEFFLQEQPTDATVIYFRFGLGEQAMKQWVGRQVIDHLSGDGGFTVYGADDAPVDVSVSGYRLTLP
jgi:hypothetical protein